MQRIWRPTTCLWGIAPCWAYPFNEATETFLEQDQLVCGRLPLTNGTVNDHPGIWTDLKC